MTKNTGKYPQIAKASIGLPERKSGSPNPKEVIIIIIIIITIITTTMFMVL